MIEKVSYYAAKHQVAHERCSSIQYMRAAIAIYVAIRP